MYTYIHTAVPIVPAHGQIMCNYDKYQQLEACITVLEVKVNKTAVITQNQDTSDINLITLMTTLGAELSISPYTAAKSDSITANFSYTDECKEQFHVNVTLSLIDKCGQRSSPVVIECKPKGIPSLLIRFHPVPWGDRGPGNFPSKLPRFPPKM